MHPQSTPELFTAVAANKLDSMRQEQKQRILNAGTIGDLVALFEGSGQSPSIIADPVMIGKLFALQTVQRTHIGVAGFDALSAISPYENHSVAAIPAPHHDSFTDELDEFRTRAIQLVTPDAHIDIIGLNLYIADMEMSMSEEPISGIILVNMDGKSIHNTKPISGDVSVIAVRNHSTGDAKIYKIDRVLNDELENHRQQVSFDNDSTARVVLPDGQHMTVSLLSGAIERQVVREFIAASDALRDAEHDAKSTLSPEERAAAQAVKREKSFISGGY